MLSDKDQQLIAILRDNARISVAALARKTNVSRTAAQARLDKLENNGTIAGYCVRLGDQAEKSQVKALVLIKLQAAERARIEARLISLRALESLHTLSGVYDLSAVIVAQNVSDLDQQIDTIGQINGVVETMSSIMLTTKVERS